MAKNSFKGFKQVIEGSFTAQTGYLYFVRNSANTGKTDGYLLFNGKKYGTAAEVSAALNSKIGTLPEGYENLVDYINANVSSITENYATNTTVGTLSGRVDSLEAISAGTRISELEAVSAGTRISELEALSAGTRITELEEVSAATRISELEAVSADTRISALENLSGESHTHANKSVLDGISAEDIQAWDSAEADAISASTVVLSALTSPSEGYAKSYEIFQGGSSLGKIDIPKDMVVSSGETVVVEGVKYLRLYIANSSEHVDIAVADLAHVYTQGNGITITTGDVVEAKVVAENGLSVDAQGIKMGLADATHNGAMSAADFVKLSGIESGSQVNIIEKVKVNGTELTVTNKEVDIVLPSATESGSSHGVEVEVVQVSGSVTEVNVSAPDFENIYTPLTTTGTLSGRVDALEAVSADTRLSELEAVSAETRISELEAVSADTRLEALENLTGTTSSALQEIVSGDTSVTITEKSQDKKQSVSVKISAAADNALELKSDGLFAGIYYEDEDTE